MSTFWPKKQQQQKTAIKIECPNVGTRPFGMVVTIQVVISMKAVTTILLFLGLFTSSASAICPSGDGWYDCMQRESDQRQRDRVADERERAAERHRKEAERRWRRDRR